MMIEEFGRSKEAWSKEQLDLQHGIPSHDTFGDVFAVIDAEAFSACFSNWVADLANLTSGEDTAIPRPLKKLDLTGTVVTIMPWDVKRQLLNRLLSRKVSTS